MLLTSGRKILQQFCLQGNSCVWFLAALMQTWPPSARLGPGQYLGAPGSPGPCVAPVCLGECRAMLKLRKNASSFPRSPTCFSCGREGWVNNPVFPHWSHSEWRTGAGCALSLSMATREFNLSSPSPPSLTHTTPSPTHMGEKHHYLQILHQVKHPVQGNPLLLPSA